MQRIKDLPLALYRPIERETITLLLAIVLLLVFGTCGYMFIEGWSFLDSVYMTVTTVATVGFGEVHQLTDPGRIFTMILIFMGVGAFAVVLTTLSGRIIQKQLIWVLRRRKMNETIAKLKHHTILCGYGRLGRLTARSLKEASHPFLIIERDEGRAAEAESAGYLVLTGDATADETLLAAGIVRAKHIVCLMPKDADNLYVILTSREINPGIYILSRSEEESGEKRLKRAGADRIVSPSRVGGQRIADGLLRPYVTDFMDLASSGSKVDLHIEEIRIPATSPLHAVTLKDSQLRQKTNVIVAAIITAAGEMVFNPSGETLLESGSTLIGLGRRADFAGLEKLIIG